MRRATLTAAVLVAATAVGAMSVGAAAAPSTRPAEFCIPILLPCATPEPTTSPSPATPDGLPGLPALPSLPGAPETPSLPDAPGEGAEPTPDPAVTPVPDDGAPVFTQPPAQLGSESLSFSGLRGIEVVTVPLADGSRVAALKLSADRITIDGFALTVRHDTGPALATTADRMTLSGNVQVYVNSLTATGPDGQSLTLGADTPPPKDGIAPSLLRVTLGLVGATADSITYSNTHQQLSE
jgi:hypothetical protein